MILKTNKFTVNVMDNNQRYSRYLPPPFAHFFQKWRGGQVAIFEKEYEISAPAAGFTPVFSTYDKQALSFVYFEVWSQCNIWFLMNSFVIFAIHFWNVDVSAMSIYFEFWQWEISLRKYNILSFKKVSEISDLRKIKI